MAIREVDSSECFLALISPAKDRRSRLPGRSAARALGMTLIAPYIRFPQTNFRPTCAAPCQRTQRQNPKLPNSERWPL